MVDYIEPQSALKSGCYTITNVAHSNRARMSNEDDKEPIMCWVPYGGGVVQEEQNVRFNRYMATSPHATLNGSVFGTVDIYWWHVYADASGPDVYRICTTASARDTGILSLSLPDEREGTPTTNVEKITLMKWGVDLQSLWKIEPYPRVIRKTFPFKDDSYLSLRLLEHIPRQNAIKLHLYWGGLPPGKIIKFTRPLSVFFHDEMVASAEVDDELETQIGTLQLSLLARDTYAFSTFIEAILYADVLQVSFESNAFQCYPAEPQYKSPDWKYVYTASWRKNLTFRGMQCFRNKVSLKKIRLTGSDVDPNGPFLKAKATVSLINETYLMCIANLMLEIYFGEHKNFVVHANSDNEREMDANIQPLFPPSPEIQRLIASYLTSSQQLLPVECKWSPEIPGAFLVGRFLTSVRLAIDVAAVLDIVIKAASVTIEGYNIDGLTFDIGDIPFSIHLWDASPDAPPPGFNQLSNI
ncbi:hypothetical protein WOLCODRAFT_20578 [Wolfiporia cocos MD-104 SS10]|uniref:Uncharacterized protein n=1 Tax=Wolfiporia cocos (strain MD-104) TaxID=742152 RepID=A0A2H3JFM7_WOLCO|nr:hypothetical protein WOLCODRAFT_20578 [Wolfiporia cocos MD-104 SS10]